MLKVDRTVQLIAQPFDRLMRTYLAGPFQYDNNLVRCDPSSHCGTEEAVIQRADTDFERGD